MPKLIRRIDADSTELAEARTPRDDVITERPDGPGRFVASIGPVSRYERTLRDEPGGSVTEVIDYRLAPLVWPIPFGLLYHRALARRPRRGSRPFWAPPDTFDAIAATAVGALCVLAVVFGYLGTLLTQTITFAADEFGASKSDQGLTLAAVRVGVLGAVALTALADRRGRRRMLLVTATAATLITALSALAPDLFTLGLVQTVARSLATAGGLLLAVVAAEEMPAGSRAFAISLITMAGAFGVGLCVFALPMADLGSAGWRLLYVVPLLGLFLLRLVARHLVESRRFAVTHARVPMAGHGRRFWLLAASALLLNVFTTPAAQLMNEFLRDERGFSAARISLFTILTNTPGVIGIVIGGRLADTRGRRMVGAVGIVGGVALTVAMVLAAGWPMWVLSVFGAVVGAAVVPALGVYGPELFPTSLRGRANGMIAILGVTGSALGLVIAGVLSDRWGGFGPALAALSVGPAVMAVLVLVAYPETAHLELEDINPEDPRIDVPVIAAETDVSPSATSPAPSSRSADHSP